jgi:hypothetical protein
MIAGQQQGEPEARVNRPANALQRRYAPVVDQDQLACGGQDALEMEKLAPDDFMGIECCDYQAEAAHRRSIG